MKSFKTVWTPCWAQGWGKTDLLPPKTLLFLTYPMTRLSIVWFRIQCAFPIPIQRVIPKRMKNCCEGFQNSKNNLWISAVCSRMWQHPQDPNQHLPRFPDPSCSKAFVMTAFPGKLGGQIAKVPGDRSRYISQCFSPGKYWRERSLDFSRTKP